MTLLEILAQAAKHFILPKTIEHSSGSGDIGTAIDTPTVSDTILSGEQEISDEDDNDNLLEEEDDGAIFRKKAKKAKAGKMFDSDEDVEFKEDNHKGDKRCRTVPFEIKKRVNKYVDNKVESISDKDFDSKVRSPESIEARKNIQHRPAAVKVKVKCRKCDKRFLIQPELAPSRLLDGDSTSYVCDKCILQGKADNDE